MKTYLFQSCGHCWVFQICWHTECSTLTTSSFRICRSLARIASPQLTLIKVMHPKAHLTSHSRTSGSRSVITPLYLSGSWRSFLYSSVNSHHILISSASVSSIPFLSFIVPIFAWNVPLVSLIFLQRSLAFPILLFSSISLHCSLKKAFLSLLAVLHFSSVQFSCSVVATPWTAACQASYPSLTHGVYSNCVHWVGDAIQLSHPLSSPSPAFNIS